MLEQMPSRLFLEWSAFNRINPFGEWRDDYRTGIIASTVCNIKRDPKKGHSFTPEDFIPEFNPVQKEIDQVSLKEKILNIARLFGAKVKSSEKK